jgi:hypothetical protein
MRGVYYRREVEHGWLVARRIHVEVVLVVEGGGGKGQNIRCC